jgi:hypothetical protein
MKNPLNHRRSVLHLLPTPRCDALRLLKVFFTAVEATNEVLNARGINEMGEAYKTAPTRIEGRPTGPYR